MRDQLWRAFHRTRKARDSRSDEGAAGGANDVWDGQEGSPGGYYEDPGCDTVTPPDKTVIADAVTCKDTPGGQPQVWDHVKKVCVDAKDVTPWAGYVADARGLLDSAKEKLWKAVWWSFIPVYGNQKAWDLCTEAIDIGRQILELAGLVKEMGGEGQSDILEEAGATVVFYGRLFRWLTGIPFAGGFAALLVFMSIGYWQFTLIRARLEEDKVKGWESPVGGSGPPIVPAPGEPPPKPPPDWGDRVKAP